MPARQDILGNILCPPGRLLHSLVCLQWCCRNGKVRPTSMYLDATSRNCQTELCSFFGLFVLFCSTGMEPRVLCLLGKCRASELHPQPQRTLLMSCMWFPQWKLSGKVEKGQHAQLTRRGCVWSLVSHQMLS